MFQVPHNTTTRSRLLDVLACPQCHQNLNVAHDDGQLLCSACRHSMQIRDGVVITGSIDAPSFFDQRFETMQTGNREPGIWSFCYDQQVKYLREALRTGDLLIDVGCGPDLVYAKEPGWKVIGVDPSLPSLKANAKLDLRVFGTAERMPIADASVDAVVCFYSVHHMVGKTIGRTTENVRAALTEFRRVVRLGGSIIIFDMSPWWPFWVAQKIAWNGVRKVLGDRLDMYFWRSTALTALGAEYMPGCRLVSGKFKSDWTTTFPPIFSLPRVRLPRVLYPLEPWLYHWVIC